jgi:CubicO group peptidase (beta-lactamase class C family)
MSRPLPRATPEDLGIASPTLTAFVEALGRSGQEIHSFMLVRHGSVAAEAWWKPYAPELPHMLFSLSKSFTSTGVGLAAAEGKLSVDDPVLRFLPDEAPKRPSKYLQAMRVRHLLSMSTGHEADTLGVVMRGGSRNWAKRILSQKVGKQPGTLFVYNSGASYLLSAIVQKVTGQRLLDYLTPRLFEPLGIEGATWERCPRGIDTGGWGLSVTTEDIAKFGLLYLRRGTWDGRRLLPDAWVDEATRSHISNAGAENPDWAQGYGYQFWRCRHGAYRGDGAFGQYCVVMPEQDAVLAMTSGAPDMQAILNVVWDTLLPALGEKPKVVKRHQQELRRTLAGLRLDPPAFRENPAAAGAVDGKTYELEANDAKLRSLSFAFAKGRLILTLRGRRTSRYRCGAGKWSAGKTRLDGSRDRATQPVRCAYTWTAAGALEATVRTITTPFRTTISCSFAEDAVEVALSANVSWGPPQGTPIRGKLVP